jgi:hypothetical protein
MCVHVDVVFGVQIRSGNSRVQISKSIYMYVVFSASPNLPTRSIYMRISLGPF